MADYSGEKKSEIIKKISENVANGAKYYKCYFKPHSIYFYDVEGSEKSEIKKILVSAFEKTPEVSISEPDKKLRIEFFDTEKEKVFLELRKNAEGLKSFEGKLKVEVFRMEMPILKTFSKPETPVLLEDTDVKKFKNGFGSDLKVDIGASAIRKLLEEINLEEEQKQIQKEIAACSSDMERSRLIRRLRIVEGFKNSNKT